MEAINKKIIIIDESSILREGIKNVIHGCNGFVVCGETGRIFEAYSLIEEKNPAITIMNMNLPSVDSISLIVEIKKHYPHMKILVISDREESFIFERAFQAGVDGFLNFYEPTENLIKAVQTILRGDLYYDSGDSRGFMESMLRSFKSNNPLKALSKREQDVFFLIGSGLDRQKIAEKLNISLNTLESHKQRIKDKLNMTSAHDLTRFAIENYHKYLM
ncbi:MAG: DNA-binding response regulator [Candidatus Omnitrophota bacterium]|jgi:DNA-binding NarL/FixJ family response regulator|nr:MAG: DNA-binding response regulator [Candidatus Omnitrophota bacterium]